MPLKRSVAAPPDAPPTLEQVRQQAKRRLIGVSVLVLAAVVVFPLIFDTQPRPVVVDMPIEIPSRKTAKPLQVDSPMLEPAAAPASAETLPAAAAPASAAASAPGAAAASGATVAGASAARQPREEIIPTAPRAAAPAAAPASAAAAAASRPPVAAAPSAMDSAAKAPPPLQAKPASSAETKAEPKPVAKPAAPAPTAPAAQADAQTARALALLEGREAAPSPPAGSAPAAAPRYIVQVGAFAEAAAAQAARLKLERAGLKTYTHVAQLPEGKRTRVRLGPFATRAEAEQAAAKAKAQGFSVAILTL